jgi:hypothetical protein
MRPFFRALRSIRVATAVSAVDAKVVGGEESVGYRLTSGAAAARW